MEAGVGGLDAKMNPETGANGFQMNSRALSAQLSRFQKKSQQTGDRQAGKSQVDSRQAATRKFPVPIHSRPLPPSTRTCFAIPKLVIPQSYGKTSCTGPRNVLPRARYHTSNGDWPQVARASAMPGWMRTHYAAWHISDLPRTRTGISGSGGRRLIH